MEKQNTFTAAIGLVIESTYGNGEKFSRSDFFDLAKEYGKANKAITHVLREMEQRGGLRIAGTIKSKNGGSPTTFYARIAGTKLVPDANYRKFVRADWKRDINEKAEYANQCGIRLHEVLDRMTLARLG